MVVRALTYLRLALLIILLSGSVASACFGPKLYLGVDDTEQSRLLTALVSLYVREKTGTETVLVPLEGKSVRQLLDAEKIDYGFSGTGEEGYATLLMVDGVPSLVSGPRIPGELQFTTVAPALKKLEGRLTAGHVAGMLAEIEAGKPPKAVARRFLMDRRWI